MARFKFKRKQPDFKPDVQTSTWWKTAHLTQTQRQRLSKWALYVFSILLALVVQDVIMSRLTFFGATTDLAVGLILLITVLEGIDVGSVFVLIASTVYYFTGTAPGAYCIGLMCVFGIGAALLRQMYLHRSRGSIVMCAGLAQIAYEIGLYGLGLFYGLTRWDRIGSFLLTGVYTAALMILFYPMIYKIGLIGGNTWKE